MDELIFNDIVQKFDFEGFGRIYDGPCYFYRTEPIKWIKIEKKKFICYFIVTL